MSELNDLSLSYFTLCDKLSSIVSVLPAKSIMLFFVRLFEEEKSR